MAIKMTRFQGACLLELCYLPTGAPIHTQLKASIEAK